MDGASDNIPGRPATYTEVILLSPRAAFVQVCMNLARREPWVRLDGDPRFAIRAHIWDYTPGKRFPDAPTPPLPPVWVAAVPQAHELVKRLDTALAADLERTKLPPEAVVELARQVLVALNFPMAMLQGPGDGASP